MTCGVVDLPALDGGAADGEAAPVADPWRLTQTQWQPEHGSQDETLFALANGVLGVRGGFEESRSPTQASFIAAVWERSPILYHERHFGFARTTDTRVPVPDATPIDIRIGGERIDPADGECLEFERVLDFRRGMLLRRMRWRTAGGHTFEVQAERIVAFGQPGLAAIRWRLQSIDYAGPVALDSRIAGDHVAVQQGDDPRLGTGLGLTMRTSRTAADAGDAWVAQRTHISGIGAVCVQAHRVDGAALAEAHADVQSVRQTFAATLSVGSVVTIEKYVAYAWTQPNGAESDDELHAAARRILAGARDAGFDALATAQAAALAAFWASAEIAIDGGEAGLADEQALRFNLFHLFQSASRDAHGGIAAKGLTGEGYEGHVFWDSETFVLPVYAFTAPALMKPSLVWRFRSLDRARAHAREMNHERGALYPWRTIMGDECSAHYPSGSAQYHINAAVAHAIRLYVDASGDREFLVAMGAEMLFETARIWLQVGHFNARRGGAFCIHAVTGPDEYTALVDNNWYTNRMAQEHLRYAARVARDLASSEPAIYAALTRTLALEEGEIGAWLRAADAMYLPYDERLAIVAQDDTFLDKPKWDFVGTPPDKYPLLMHHHPLTLYRHQVCKQADAVLALVLAGAGVDAATKRRSFDYYESVTVHDSTLSASTFAVLAAEVGYPDKAQRYFQETLRVDLDDLHRNASHGAHLAAMAGSWLALAMGFGGLRVEHDGDGAARLKLDPILPPGWRGYRFGIAWQGRRVRVDVDGASVRYAVHEGDTLEIAHADQRVVLLPGVPALLPLQARQPAPKARFPRPIKALIFDLDGVLTHTAHLHEQAWRRLAAEIGLPWDESAGERLKGVDRAASLEIVLGAAASRYTKEQKAELAERKNGYYRSTIEAFSARDLLPGALAALESARAAGLKIALASASRSAADLVERLGIARYFDVVVDSATVANAKPDPEIFQRAAAALGVDPAACLGIEDARAGIAAIKSAGMAALGIGDAQALSEADAVLPELAAFDIRTFVTRAEPDRQRTAPSRFAGKRKEKHSTIPTPS